MESRSKNLPFRPVVVETRTEGFDQNAVEVIERSLDFTTGDGR